MAMFRRFRYSSLSHPFLHAPGRGTRNPGETLYRHAGFDARYAIDRLKLGRCLILQEIKSIARRRRSVDDLLHSCRGHLEPPTYL